MCGGFYVSNPTLKRFFVFHFLGPVILCALATLHLYFLHYASSSHPWGYNTYNLSTFCTLVLSKDLFGLVLLGLLWTLQHIQNQFSLCHSDNSLEVNGLVTPLHIVPEWYFLGSYAVLKAIPNKVEGFIIFVGSVLVLLLDGEGKTISTLTSMLTRDLFCTHFFLLLKYGLWIGAQLPQDIFLS